MTGIVSARESMWHTADGRSIRITEMTLSHLVNVINWIGANPSSYRPRIFEIMVNEAKARQVLLFAEGKEYPQLIANQWKLINPKTGEGSINAPPKDYIEAVKDNQRYQEMSKRTQAKRRLSK